MAPFTFFHKDIINYLHNFVKINKGWILEYDENMKKVSVYQKYQGKKIPLLVEKGEDGFFVIECPIFSGCFTQGKTIDEAMANIREAIELVLEEKENQARLEAYVRDEMRMETITL
jgi:predicted RNase H-like HicB family nuclease